MNETHYDPESRVKLERIAASVVVARLDHFRFVFGEYIFGYPHRTGR